MLAGFAMLSVAVYLGLRRRTYPQSSPSQLVPTLRTDTSPRSYASGAPAPSNVQLEAAASSSSSAESNRRGSLEAQLTAARSGLLAKCGAPAVTSATYVFNFSFAADGRQLGRGMDAPRGSPAQVGPCLQREMPNFAVPPSDVPLYVEVPFSFP